MIFSSVAVYCVRLGVSSDISVLFPRCSEVKTYSTLADSTIPTKRKFEDTNGAIKPEEPVSKKIKIEGSIMVDGFSRLQDALYYCVTWHT